MEQDDLIFNFLKPSQNTKLCQLKKLDLQELIILIKKFYLSLRNTLNLDDSITFGLEIEFEHANTEMIDSIIDKKYSKGDDWCTVFDGSLDRGEEINSPILRDSIKTWIDLKKVCSIVRRYAKICNHSSGHVHVGTQTLGDNSEAWINFILLWSVYENIIFRFSYGEYYSNRPCIIKYAKPISNVLWDSYENLNLIDKNDLYIDDIIDNISVDRYQAVNFHNVEYENISNFSEGNTIEFRCPNGSLNPIIWQNNVNLFIKMLLCAKNSNLDKDLILKRRRDTNVYYSLDWYSEIFLDQALEFADLIFDNNLDKLYFLRQYLKDFNFSSSGEYAKCKKFTR